MHTTLTVPFRLVHPMAFCLGSLLLGGAAQAQGPTITGLAPIRNALAVPRNTTVAATFNQPLNGSSATAQALRVHSQQAGGLKAGSVSVNGSTLAFDPTANFSPGETVFATMTAAAQGANGQAAVPHVFQFTAAAAPAPATFAGGSTVLALGSPFSVALGDVDNDGDLDLAAVNYYYTKPGTVSISLNNGNAGFSSLSEVRVGNGPGIYEPSEPQKIVFGDVDNDGDLDFLTGNGRARTISVRFNNGTGTFSGTQEVPVTSDAIGLAVGDIDGDGDLDIVATNSGVTSNTVSVRLNNGNGIFGGGSEVPVGTQPSSVVLGDVDADGDLDMLTANSLSDNVSVRLNNGNGTFTGGADFAVGDDPRTVALGDVDGDGDLDFATANLAVNSSSVRLNNGSGVFTGNQEVSLLAQSLSEVVLSDLDGDGDLDLLGASYFRASTSVRLNNGGIFGGGSEVAGGAKSLAVGDVDGDGDIDLVTATTIRLNRPLDLPTITSIAPGISPVGSNVVITGTNFLNATSITFSGIPAAFVFNSNTQLTATVPAGATSGPVVVTTGIGASTGFPFTVGPLLTLVSLSPGRNAVAVPRTTSVAATFNQVLGVSSPLAVFSRQAGGRKAGTSGVTGNTLRFTPTTAFKPGETVFATATRGVRNPAGTQNLLLPKVFQFTTATVPSAGAFTGTATLAVGLKPRGVAVGDVNGDGKLDMITANDNSNTLSLRLGDGNGGFGSIRPVNVGQFSASSFFVLLADLDNDGDLDLINTNPNDDLNIGRFTYNLNDGLGNFAPSTSRGGGSFGDSPHGIAAGDLDGDGDLDLLVANYTNRGGPITTTGVGTVTLVRNNVGISTAALLESKESFAVGSRPLNVVVGDVDNDGDLDFVTASSNGATASVRLNDGNGSFSGNQEVPVGFNPQSVALGDVDGDGDLDLLTANYYDYTNPTGSFTKSTASVRLNNGNGLFGGTLEVPLGEGATTIATSDVDGDGDLDLLATNELSNTVSVRLNNGSGSFSGSQEVAVGNSPYGLALGDLNDDGALDLITANTADNTVSVRLNQLLAPGTAYQLNAGGLSLNTSRGTFAADQYYSASSAVSTTAASIAGTTDDALYQTERYSTNGQLSYALPVPNGTYNVVLHFAETYWTQPGQRVFNIGLEGNTVRTNYDIVAKVGPLAATTETFLANVTDGVLNLELVVPYEGGGHDQAKLSALEITLATTSNRGTLATGVAARSTAGRGLAAYPNPTPDGRVTISYTASEAQTGTLTLLDQLGRPVHAQPVHLQPGLNRMVVKPAAVRPGLYQLVLRTADGQRSTQKVVVQP